MVLARAFFIGVPLAGAAYCLTVWKAWILFAECMGIGLGVLAGFFLILFAAAGVDWLWRLAAFGRRPR